MGFSDVLWFLLFALLAAAAGRYSQWRYGYWFTPVSVFMGVNCASLCAYHLRLLDMNDVSLPTHALVLGGFLMFFWGAHVAGGPRRDEAGGGDPWGAHGIDRTGLSHFFYATALLSTLGWVTAAAILVARHGLAALLANPWVLQLEFQMQFIGYLNLLGILVLPTYVLLARSQGFRWLPLLLALSGVWGLMLAGIKAYLVYSGLIALFCWSVAAPRRFRARHLLLGMLALLAFFIAYNQVIDVFVVEIHTGHGPFSRLVALHRPYAYFAGPWPAMDAIVHGRVEPPRQFASVVLDPLWKVLGDGLGLIEPVPLALPFTDIGTTLFNVYTFFGEVYRDLKLPGTLLLSWLLGFLGTRLYLRARAGGYWGHALAYGIVGHGIFLSCFMYTFRFNLVFMLLYLYAYGFVALRRGVLVDRRRPEPRHD